MSRGWPVCPTDILPNLCGITQESSRGVQGVLETRPQTVPGTPGEFQVTVCGVTVCPFSRHKGNQSPKCLLNKAQMHLSRNCPFSSKTNLHLELPGTLPRHTMGRTPRGSSLRRCLEGRNTPFRRVRPPLRAPYTNRQIPLCVLCLSVFLLPNDIHDFELFL